MDKTQNLCHNVHKQTEGGLPVDPTSPARKHAKSFAKDLSNISNISFADKSDDVLIDFYIQTIGKGNICSCSSFSVAGAILNKNKNCVIPEPFFKNKSYNTKDNLQIVPRWSKREQVTEDMQ